MNTRKIKLFVIFLYALQIQFYGQRTNFKIFTNSELEAPFYYTPNKEKVKRIEFFLLLHDPLLWFSSKRQYIGINHPKEGEIIDVNIVPISLMNIISIEKKLDSNSRFN